MGVGGGEGGRERETRRHADTGRGKTLEEEGGQFQWMLIHLNRHQNESPKTTRLVLKTCDYEPAVFT